MSDAKQRRSQKRVLKSKGERIAASTLKTMVDEGIVSERGAKKAAVKVQVNPGKPKP